MDFIGRICRPLIECCTNDEVGPFLDATEVLKIVQPTDLIEFRRKQCIHWGMYTDFDAVIHLQNHNGEGIVEEELLLTVALGGKEETEGRTTGDKCRINNKDSKLHEWAKLPGFITETRDPDVVIEEARKWKYMKLKYDLTSNNCEHLCMKWKYGVSKSEQVESAALLIGTGGATVTTIATAAAVELVEDAAKDEAKEQADEERKKAEDQAKAQAETAKENAKGFFKGLF